MDRNGYIDIYLAAPKEQAFEFILWLYYLQRELMTENTNTSIMSN